MNASVFRLAENISWKKMDDLVIAVDLKTGAYYSLNQTASQIWEQIMAGQSLEEVKERLTGVFDVTEAALRTDLARCIEEWTAHGLIVRNEA